MCHHKFEQRLDELIAANNHVNEVCARAREHMLAWSEQELRLSCDEMRELADQIESMLDESEEVVIDDRPAQELY